MNVHNFLQYRMEKTAAMRTPIGSLGKALRGKSQTELAGLGMGLGKKPKPLKMMSGLGSIDRTKMRYGNPDYKLKPGERFGSDIVSRPLANRPNQLVRTTQVFSPPMQGGNRIQGPPARKVINQLLRNQ